MDVTRVWREPRDMPGAYRANEQAAYRQVAPAIPRVRRDEGSIDCTPVCVQNPGTLDIHDLDSSDTIITMMGGRSTVLCLALMMFLALGCDKPVACASYDFDGGTRPSLGPTTLTKPVNKRTWSNCSDGKTRTVRCTPGHLSPWKCMCSIDGVDKLETRPDADFPDERVAATATANETCDWQLR